MGATQVSKYTTDLTTASNDNDDDNDDDNDNISVCCEGTQATTRVDLLV